MKNLLLIVFSIFFIANVSYAQSVEECASGTIHNRLMQNDPAYAQQFQFNNALIKNLSKNGQNNKSGTILEIPVVVHIIHTGQAVGTGANISMTQINSAITRMNDRYRNTHLSSVDTEIQFVLAKRDPNGNATTGVVRVDGSSVTDYSTEGITAGNGSGAVEATVKALSIWSNTNYYNIWVVSEIEDNNGLFGIQGYAYFPGASATVDGTVIMHTCFGTTGTVNSFNNQGRTLVHELGHGLNLFHTFEGDNSGASCPSSANGCGSGLGDCVSDTDPHIRAASNCPTGTNSCTGGSIDDVTSNFMNYSSQTCALEFTTGQSTRMRAAIQTSRPSLLSSLGGTAPGSSVINAACTPTTTTPNNAFGFGIRQVKLNNLHVVSSTSNDEGGYVDHTKLQLSTVDAGSSYTITINTGNANNEDVEVYIDYNNDGDFLDAGENVFSSSSAKVHSGTINVPSSGITTGTLLRMRVIGDWESNTISGSCYNPQFGQTEDYALSVTSAGPALSVSTTGTDASCNGGSSGTATATASGGSSPYTYIWTSGGIGATQNNLSAGIYTVTVTDNASGTASTSITITEPLAIGASLTSTNASCAASDGAVSTNTTGGTAPYTYTWSTGASNMSISNLAVGTYSVTITDANGCTTSSSASITQSCANVNLKLEGKHCTRTGLDPTNTLLTIHTHPSATNYRIRVNGAGVSNFVYTTINNRFNLSEIPGMQYNQNYTVEVAAFISGQWSNYGDMCTISTGGLSIVNLYLRGGYCNKTNLDPLNDLLYFHTRADASNYRVRVNGSGVSNFVHTTAGNRFNISDITGIQYNQSYTVEIAAFIGGQWSSYGNVCTVTTGSLLVINLYLRNGYCAKTNLDPQNSLLYFYTRSDATNHRVRVNGSGVSNFVHTTTSNRFNLSEIPGIQYSQSYTVEIAAFIGGQWSSYGNVCTVTTGSISVVNLYLRGGYCTKSNVNPLNSLLYFYTRSDATNYRARINGSGVSNHIHTTTNNRFNISLIPGVQNSQSYTVEIAAFVGGQWSNYGNVCTITTIPAAAPASRLKFYGDDHAGSQFSMYPNPSASQVVTIQYVQAENNLSDNTVSLEVLDITGKRILRKQLRAFNGKLTSEINREGLMKPGIYFVKLEDGDNKFIEKLIIQ